MRLNNMVETYIKLLGIFGILFIIYFPFAFVDGLRKSCVEKHKELFKFEQEEKEKQNN